MKTALAPQLESTRYEVVIPRDAVSALDPIDPESSLRARPHSSWPDR